jgi:formylmethanofuran:tetrahydromethanopterin formyltransferase
MPPAFAPVGVHKQSGVQRNVPSLNSRTGVYQAVGANHLSTGITQDRELAVHNAVPDMMRVLAVVNADGYKTGVEGVELFLMPRELAQLARAVRSPVPAIENQEHAVTAQ